MKSTSILICLVFITILSSSNRLTAQSEFKTASERAQFQTERMTSSLKLDSVQVEKVGRINLKYAQKMDPIIKGNGSKISKFRAFKSINDEKQAELKKVLTKEQFAEFQRQQEEMKERLRENRK